MLRIAAHLLALLYVSQVFLGAFTIWLGAPEALRGAHLALAAATWSALVVLATLIWAGETDDRRLRRKSAARNMVPERVRLYFSLIKPRVIPLLLVPTVASMLMAAVQHPPDPPRPRIGFHKDKP